MEGCQEINVKNEFRRGHFNFKMTINVYMNIVDNAWNAYILKEDECIEIGSDEKEQDVHRSALVCTLELLQFLRNWCSDESFVIYTNNQYSVLCIEKWIPLWAPKGFRINHTSKLRPHTDLLVKLFAFKSCMSFKFVQHYSMFEQYHSLFPQQTNYTNRTTYQPPVISVTESPLVINA